MDFVAQLPTMMFPLLAVTLGMTYGMIGLAALVAALSGSIAQMIFGYLGDRVGRRWIAALSASWMAAWVAAAAFVPSYGLLLLFLAISGIGTGAFHPQGAASAHEAAGARKGASVATFFLGGHLGYAVSPLVAGAVLNVGGLQWIPALTVPMVLASALMLFGLRGLGARARQQKAAAEAAAAGRAGAIGVVLVVVLVRGWAYSSLNTFIPLLVSPDGPEPAVAGFTLAAFLLAQAAGAFAGGVLADRWGVRRLIGYSSLVTVPTIALFGLIPFGPLHYPLIALTGLAIGLGFTPTVLLMQRLLPRHTGTATGVVLGVSFGAGSAGNALTGFMGDFIGLGGALAVMGLAQLLVLAILRGIPAKVAPPIPLTASGQRSAV